MKQVVKSVVVVVLLLLVVLLLAALFFLGPIVRATVNTAGPALLGVPVAVGKTSILPLRGRMELADVRVGNPEGFRAPHIFEMDGLRVRMKPASVMGDTIVIDEIVIQGVRITYETTGLRSNLGALLERLEKDASPAPAPSSAEKPAKRVAIRRVILQNLALKVAATLAGGGGLTLPLDRIELENIGDRHGAVTAAAATLHVVRAIVSGAAKALAGSAADLAGLGIDAGQAIAQLGAKGVAAAAGLAVEGARAVGEGVATGASALGEGAAAGTRAVTRGAGRILRGLGELLPGEGRREDDRNDK